MKTFLPEDAHPFKKKVKDINLNNLFEKNRKILSAKTYSKT